MIPPPIEFDPATHTYTADGISVPSVTQIISGAGFIDFIGVPPHVLDAKKRLGTHVHEFTAAMDRGRMDLCAALVDRDDPELCSRAEPYCLAWRDFVLFSGFRPIRVEHRFTAELNGMRYAGTLDRLGMLDDVETVIEIKTSGSRCAWWRLQLAAYAAAMRTVGAVAPSRAAVQLLPTGGFRLHRFSAHQDEAIFAAALAIEVWKRNHP